MNILIKGAGDLATGIAYRLKEAGHQLVMTDIAVPTTVRRTVAFSAAIYEKQTTVEGMTAVRADNISEIEKILLEDKIPVIVDPKADIIKEWKPEIVVDAIIAKKNLGTKLSDASFVIGVGPGFVAGEDCHCVIETKRGHYLGRIIREGSAIPNTGVPGDIGGYTIERIIRAESEGLFEPVCSIGDQVEEGQVVAYAGGVAIKALMPGTVRGMLQPGVYVLPGMKCGDIDARCEISHCYTISDKARAIGGGVLEAICKYESRKKSLAIVLLAAGEGKRYGSNKLLATRNGKRLFEYSIDAVAAILNDEENNAGRPLGVKRIIVTAYDEIEEYAKAKGFIVVRNNHQELGISESVKLGLGKASSLGASAVVFSVSDQPGLSSLSYRKIIYGYATSNKGLACLSDDTCQMANPCLFSRKYYEDIWQLEGDKGGKKVLLAHKNDVVMIKADKEELKDIDCPEDN